MWSNRQTGGEIRQLDTLLAGARQFAWLTWLLVHLWYLVGFQNRILVFIRWSFSFATHGRGARLITEAEATKSRDELRSSSG